MLMISSSLGPKNRHLRLACHGVSLALIAVRAAFARRNRCTNAMMNPDVKSVYSATLAAVNIELSGVVCACLIKYGSIRIYIISLGFNSSVQRTLIMPDNIK
jgi:hypothetical protein